MSKFSDIADQIEQSGKPKGITVRKLIESFGHYRRGKNVNRKIRNSLKRHKLTTEPDFELVHVDSRITVKPLEQSTTVVAVRKRTRMTNSSEQAKPVEDSKADSANDAEREVILTIGQLPSADRKPTFISRSESIERAITLLLQDGVDHLVVSQNERQAEGIVTWASIGKTRAGRRECRTVNDCMELQPWIVRYDHPLFDAVREITHRGMVIVTSDKALICGTVTSADIAQQFVSLSEPFLFLEQIENHLRALLRSVRLGTERLKAMVDPRDEARQKRLKSVDDLTFGETWRAFDNKDIWEKLGLPLDRKTLRDRLETVNEIRNSVMHFHPDGISDEERQILRLTREMLQII